MEMTLGNISIILFQLKITLVPEVIMIIQDYIKVIMVMMVIIHLICQEGMVGIMMDITDGVVRMDIMEDTTDGVVREDIMEDTTEAVMEEDIIIHIHKVMDDVMITAIPICLTISDLGTDNFSYLSL